MLPWSTRLTYAVAAMSASFAVFTYLHEREEVEDREKQESEESVTATHFFQAMESLTLTTQQKIELQKFWRNLCDRATEATVSMDSNNSIISTSGLRDQEPMSTVSMATETDIVGNVSVKLCEIHQFAHEYKQLFPEIFPEDLVLEVTRRAVESSLQSRAGIVGSTSTMIRSTTKRFHSIAKGTKDEVQDVMHRTLRKYLERALDVFADRLKHAIKDPHMPQYLKDNIDLMVNQFMPDVKVEIFRKTRDLLVAPDMILPQSPSRHEIKKTSISKRSIFRRIRGHILYHTFPYDKSIWLSFKDPWWIFYSTVGIFPVIGQLWWLLLFLIKDKTNEHQLCQFIIGFKVAQFISLGVFATTIGVIRYVRCVVNGVMEECRESGPMLETWNSFFFILQIALVWIAFFRLPYTERPNEKKHALLYRTSSMDRKERRVHHDIFGNQLHLNRGGYLMKLLGYETLSFGIIVMMTCLVLSLSFEPWQSKALFYWLRTLYGLVSLPFILFKIPLLAKILMHTRPMGYNQEGETVQQNTTE